MSAAAVESTALNDDVVIRVRNLVKRFGGRPGVTGQAVLDGVSFDVLRGETLVIMGGSGCGKSTLLNCMIAELPVDEGEIVYRLRDGRPAVDVTRADDETVNQVRRRFGILFQSGALFNSMTVAQNVAYPLLAHTRSKPDVIDIVVTVKLEQVAMLPHREKMPAQLSGGQKKRVGLARATALDPEVLYFDEPSAGLDPVTSAAVDQLMMNLSRKLNVTSIVVTHEMDSAFRIADRMVMLDRGRVLKIGPRHEFEKLRDAPPEELATPEERLMRQFLNGRTVGPLTDAAGLTEFEKLLKLEGA